MGRKVFVVGVGMTKFEKPGAREGWDYPQMAEEAGTKALADAGIPYAEIEQACVGYVYGESTCGQRAVYGLGLTGIPVYNVNNNCSTGSTALFMAKQLIEGGIADCVLALGFEKMERGSLREHWGDRASATGLHVGAMAERRGMAEAPPAPQLFGNAGREYMERYGVTQETIAKIAVKNHAHSANNPNSQFRDVYTLDQVLGSPEVYAPLTKLQCCPTSDGGAAAVVVSERFVDEHDLWDQAVEIAGQAMTTDFESTFDGTDAGLVGAHMTRMAAHRAYEQAGVGPEDIDVIELHDCFSTNELVTYEALGLCEEGGAGELVDTGAVDYGGRWVVNPSGGLISKGHPLGATGLAQCAELSWQLRGQADARQVEGATVALQHNIGINGAAVVTVFTRPSVP
jgi:acetyl-CoA acyltransferase